MDKPLWMWAVFITVTILTTGILYSLYKTRSFVVDDQKVPSS